MKYTLEQLKDIVEKKKFLNEDTDLTCGYNLALDSLIRQLENGKPSIFKTQILL